MKVNIGSILKLRTAVDALHPLGSDCWNEIEKLVYLKEIQKSECFSKEGEQINNLALIDSGILRIFYLDEKGSEWNKHFLQEGDFVASSLSPEKKSITTIQALSTTLLICIPFQQLVELSNKYQVVSSFIQKIMSQYLEQKQSREIRFLSNEAAKNYLIFKGEFPKLENTIQDYHIASYLGITPTQLSRIRKSM